MYSDDFEQLSKTLASADYIEYLEESVRRLEYENSILIKLEEAATNKLSNAEKKYKKAVKEKEQYERMILKLFRKGKL